MKTTRIILQMTVCVILAAFHNTTPAAGGNRISCHDGCTASADTLNILDGADIPANTKHHTAPQLSTDIISGKVEGTLTYRKGWIYTSDKQPLKLNDAKMYFTPHECKVYRRNTSIFSTGENIAIYGVSGGAGAALGFMAADACIDNGEPSVRTLAASAIIAVGVAVPCTLIGTPMMIKGKCKLKALVRKYNEHYLFQNP